MSLQKVGSSLLYKEKNNHWYLIKEEKKFLGLYLNKSTLSHRAYVTLAAEVSPVWEQFWISYMAKVNREVYQLQI